MLSFIILIFYIILLNSILLNVRINFTLQMELPENCRIDISRVYGIMVRKAAARERGRRVTKTVPLPPRLRPSHLPHYALDISLPFEFVEPLSAVCTLLLLCSTKD